MAVSIHGDGLDSAGVEELDAGDGKGFQEVEEDFRPREEDTAVVREIEDFVEDGGFGQELWELRGGGEEEVDVVIHDGSFGRERGKGWHAH